MNKYPIGVLIADIHYSLSTLEKADFSLRAAFKEAQKLSVPVFICGDLHDTKAIIRAECANAMLATFSEYAASGVSSYTIIGNHCMLNEKGEGHSLGFLSPYTTIIDRSTFLGPKDSFLCLIPYQTNASDFVFLVNQAALNNCKAILCHQGVKGAYMGEYVVDKTSADPSDIDVGVKLFSGHYHRHQTIGPLTYIGSPYTASFAEASDGPKGIQVLYSDFSLEQVEIPLPRHRVLETDYEGLISLCQNSKYLNSKDIFWVKIKDKGPLLASINKEQIGLKLFGHLDFKLTKTSTDETVKSEDLKVENKPTLDLFFDVIDIHESSEAKKQFLKQLVIRAVE